MGISVNGVDIDDTEVEQELAHHQGAGNPLKQAVHELVLRRLLLDEAQRLGLEAVSDDEHMVLTTMLGPLKSQKYETRLATEARLPPRA